MKVRVLNTFNDLEENIIRLTGEIFETNAERVGEINSHPIGLLVEVIEGEVEEDTKEDITAEVKKKTTRKTTKK